MRIKSVAFKGKAMNSGVAAPIILIVLRMLQGLALGVSTEVLPLM